MWQRALVAIIFIFAMSTLLMMSSGSKGQRASESDSTSSPVVVAAMPAEAEGAQIRLLHMQAMNAMRALIAAHMQATFCTKTDLRSSGRKNAGVPPNE